MFPPSCTLVLLTGTGGPGHHRRVLDASCCRTEHHLLEYVVDASHRLGIRSMPIAAFRTFSSLSLRLMKRSGRGSMAVPSCRPSATPARLSTCPSPTPISILTRYGRGHHRPRRFRHLRVAEIRRQAGIVSGLIRGVSGWTSVESALGYISISIPGVPFDRHILYGRSETARMSWLCGSKPSSTSRSRTHASRSSIRATAVVRLAVPRRVPSSRPTASHPVGDTSSSRLVVPRRNPIESRLTSSSGIHPLRMSLPSITPSACRIRRLSRSHGRRQRRARQDRIGRLRTGDGDGRIIVQRWKPGFHPHRRADRRTIHRTTQESPALIVRGRVWIIVRLWLAVHPGQRRRMCVGEVRVTHGLIRARYGRTRRRRRTIVPRVRRGHPPVRPAGPVRTRRIVVRMRRILHTVFAAWLLWHPRVHHGDGRM